MKEINEGKGKNFCVTIIINQYVIYSLFWITQINDHCHICTVYCWS